jgi:hypothetical protein
MTDDLRFSVPRRNLLAGQGATAIGGVTRIAVGRAAPAGAQESKGGAMVPSMRSDNAPRSRCGLPINAMPSWAWLLNLGVLFSAQGPVRTDLCAMARPISRRPRWGVTADVISSKRSRIGLSMPTVAVTTFSSFARETAEFASDFASLIHNLILDVRDSYRPGLHCMRGPGPKSRAQRESRLRFDSGSAPTDPTARDVAGVRRPL